jgi:hypothetical protein
MENILAANEAQIGHRSLHAVWIYRPDDRSSNYHGWMSFLLRRYVLVRGAPISNFNYATEGVVSQPHCQA